VARIDGVTLIAASGSLAGSSGSSSSPVVDRVVPAQQADAGDQEQHAEHWSTGTGSLGGVLPTSGS
jgi:hypothetical protein